MRLHRFVEKFNTVENYEITDRERINQISKVLRLNIGDKIILTDGEGQEAEAEIIAISKKAISVKIGKVVKKQEDWNNVVLYCNILKRENFELVVQKATEMGVAKIVPLLCERTVKQKINHQRLEKIIEEAVEQSERVFIPKLDEEMKFKNAITEAKRGGEIILFEKNGENSAKLKSSKTISIFIGPEGGWTTEEIKLAKDAGAIIKSLGETNLRAETAAIVSTFITINK